MMIIKESYQFHILDQLLVPNVAYYSRLSSSLLGRSEMKKCIQKVSMGTLGAKQSKRMR